MTENIVSKVEKLSENELARELEGVIALTQEASDKHECIFFIAKMICTDGTEGFTGIPAATWDDVLKKMSESDIVKEFFPIQRIVPVSFH